MKIPTYLQKYAIDEIENDVNADGLTTFYIQSSKGEKLFEIYYYGELVEEGVAKGYITGTEPTFSNMKIIAKGIHDGEEILIFDATEYGYNGMFCDEHTNEQKANRSLRKLEKSPSKVKLTIGYGIDYESEKEDYEFDENGNVILIDNRRISWNDLLHDGFDWLCISLIDEDRSEQEIVNEELA